MLLKNGAVLRTSQELGKVVLIGQHCLDGAQIAKDDRPHPGEGPEREEDLTEDVAELRHGATIGWRAEGGDGAFRLSHNDCAGRPANARVGRELSAYLAIGMCWVATLGCHPGWSAAEGRDPFRRSSRLINGSRTALPPSLRFVATSRASGMTAVGDCWRRWAPRFTPSSVWPCWTRLGAGVPRVVPLPCRDR